MRTGRIGPNSTVPPTQYRSALRRVITRASQPGPDPPPRSPHPLRVTASHRATGLSRQGPSATTRRLPGGSAAPVKGRIVRQRSLISITAALAAGALTLTACGSRDDDGGSDSAGGTKVVIGVDAPSRATCPRWASASRTPSTSPRRPPTSRSSSTASPSRSKPSTTRPSPPRARRTPPPWSPTRASSVSSAR